MDENIKNNKSANDSTNGSYNKVGCVNFSDKAIASNSAKNAIKNNLN